MVRWGLMLNISNLMDRAVGLDGDHLKFNGCSGGGLMLTNSNLMAGAVGLDVDHFNFNGWSGGA